MHTNPTLTTYLHTTRPIRRLFTTTLQLVEFIIFLIPAYGFDNCQYTWMLVTKTLPIISTFQLSNLWRQGYEIARAGTCTITTILELSILSPFWSCHFMLICSLLFAFFCFESQMCLEKNSFSHLRLRLRMRLKIVLLDLLETFSFHFDGSFVPPISWYLLLHLFWRCCYGTRTRDQNWHKNENETRWEFDDDDDDDEKMCVHFVYYILLNGDLIRPALLFSVFSWKAKSFVLM